MVIRENSLQGAVYQHSEVIAYMFAVTQNGPRIACLLRRSLSRSARLPKYMFAMKQQPAVNQASSLQANAFTLGDFSTVLRICIWFHGLISYPDGLVSGV